MRELVKVCRICTQPQYSLLNQGYIRRSSVGIVGESAAQASRANNRTLRIVGVRRAWVSVLVQFLRLIDQLGRDLGTLWVPLSQWDTPGLQNRFLFRTCGYRQIIMNGLSHLKRFHTIAF